MFAQASEKGHISAQLLIMPDQTNLEFGIWKLYSSEKNQNKHIISYTETVLALLLTLTLSLWGGSW